MNQATSSGGVRKPLLIAIVAVAAIVVGAIALLRPKPAATETPAAAAGTPAEPAAVRADTEYQRPKPLHAVTGTHGGDPGATPAPVEPVPAAPAPAPVPALILPGNPQPTAETRSIVAGLANVDLKSKTFTAADAAVLKESLNRLSQTGPAGVAAIQEYLALNQNVSFDGVPGAADLMGSGSLRLSLLDTLARMGGAEALALSTATLANSTDPREIALLAKNLEAQAPGEHREAAVAAARAALAQASAGQLAGKDVGPLFEVLRNYGGTSAITDLQQAAGGQWKYYATIALADLPNGAGVPALQQMINDPQNTAASSRVAALQAVAQLSADNADARNLLLDQARKGSIPAATWINVAAALAGDRFAIGSKSAEANPNLRTWHLSYGNQNYYAQPSVMTPDQIQQRLGLFDQFLQVAANNPAAVAALQNARNGLANRLVPAQ